MANDKSFGPTGGTDSAVLPLFPQFVPAEIPTKIALISRNTDGEPTREQVVPIRAWQGLITPLPDDAEARLVLRALVANLDVAVHGGQVMPTEAATALPPIQAEARIVGTGISFDVLVLEFEAPAHPWAFSLSPRIAQRTELHHPHLRSDRVLDLPHGATHGFCIYSAAEFKFHDSSSPLNQFLAQVSIFLAKHVIWLRTLHVVNGLGKIVHDGLDRTTILRSVPVDTIWQRNPKERAIWLGFWPGREAENGPAHLRLDPDDECWCGKGQPYKDCCFLWEPAFYKKHGLA
jgi:hypothetical protein